MSREIKFRAWTGTHILPVENLDFATDGLRPYINESTWVNPSTLMQYTGLKDKNGVEIYEGDIVAIYPHTATEYNLDDANICEVKWSDEGAEWVGIFANISIWAKHEVIGNIYENGDLLK